MLIVKLLLQNLNFHNIFINHNSYLRQVPQDLFLYVEHMRSYAGIFEENELNRSPPPRHQAGQLNGHQEIPNGVNRRHTPPRHQAGQLNGHQEIPNGVNGRHTPPRHQADRYIREQNFIIAAHFLSANGRAVLCYCGILTVTFHNHAAHINTMEMNVLNGQSLINRMKEEQLLPEGYDWRHHRFIQVDVANYQDASERYVVDTFLAGTDFEREIYQNGRKLYNGQLQVQGENMEQDDLEQLE